jgi:hypothetical protein
MAGLPGAVMNRDTLSGLHRRTIRSQDNPFDKATIFSIYPESFPVRHETTQPSDYLVPAGSIKEPGRLVVGPASWWRDVDPDQPLLEIRVSAIQVADSIVSDYLKARLASNAQDICPGIFYLPGEISNKELKEKHNHLILQAENRQRRWYELLVKIADVGWARTNGNPLAIDNSARLAATELGIQRDWMRNFQATELVKCVACGQLRNPEFPICQHCHVVADKKRAEELGLTFAKG